MTLPQDQDEPQECVELMWTLADPDPPPFNDQPGPLIQWYQQHGLD